MIILLSIWFWWFAWLQERVLTKRGSWSDSIGSGGKLLLLAQGPGGHLDLKPVWPDQVWWDTWWSVLQLCILMLLRETYSMQIYIMGWKNKAYCLKVSQLSASWVALFRKGKLAKQMEQGNLYYGNLRNDFAIQKSGQIQSLPSWRSCTFAYAVSPTFHKIQKYLYAVNANARKQFK